MLEKLNLILRLAPDYNSTLKKIESRGESWYISSIPSDVGEAEPKPEIVDEPELLMSQIHNQKWKSLTETPLDLLAEPIMELLLSSPVIRAPLSLRLPDVYDPLQIFLNEASSQSLASWYAV